MSTNMGTSMFYFLLTQTGLPVRYSHFTSPQAPPYLVYRGNGQRTWGADNGMYWKENNYIVEYYYKEKNPEAEDAIENILTESGIYYEKSEDIYIESEDIFVIYYYI